MRAKWTRQRCHDEPCVFLRIAARSPAWASEMTRRTPASPRVFSERRKPDQNVSSSESPTSTPRISRPPSAVIPVAITTARDTT